MASKYYAVKKGKVPGIYFNWNDCKAMVDGYPGAVYKSFKAIEEAEKLRKDYDVVIYEKPKKLSKFLDKIQAKGYFGFCFLGEEIRELKK